MAEPIGGHPCRPAERLTGCGSATVRQLSHVRTTLTIMVLMRLGLTFLYRFPFPTSWAGPWVLLLKL